jgi:hypothetical protein
MGGGGSFTEFVADTLSVAYDKLTETITITFQYLESAYIFSTGMSCTINGLPVTITSGAGTGGTGTVTFSRLNTNNLKFFTQGYTQVYQLTYTFESTPYTSGTITYYWRQSINATNLNLATSGNGFTAVDISTGNRSILLPSVTSKPGYIYRIKIIGYASPYLLRISPYLTGFNNTTDLVFGIAPYDSSIDGVLSTIRLEGANFSIALVSDGTNWSILSLYISSILSPEVGTVSGTASTESIPKQILYHSTASIYNIIIAPMTYSFIKYISILNSETSTTSFYIYFPVGKKIDTVTPGESETLRITLNIPASSSASVILTYANNQYYILGYYIFGTGDNITNNTSSSNGTILTNGINFSNTQVSSTVSLEMSAAVLNANYSIINIIKLNNDTSTVNTITINKPRIQNNSYFTIANATNIKQLSISLTSNRYTCIWLAKYYNSTYGTIILPVHYYLATASGGGISP